MKKIVLVLVFLCGCTQKIQSHQTPVMLEIGEYYSRTTFDSKTKVFQVTLTHPASKKLSELDYENFLVLEAKKEAEHLCNGLSNVKYFEAHKIYSKDNSSPDDYYKYEHILKSEFKCKAKLKVESL